MKKAIWLLISIILILTGCQGNQEDVVKKSKGVYYQKINPREITQRYYDGALYICGLLHYNERIYTSSRIFQSTDKNNLDLDSICEDELGTVYGNHIVFWSTDKDELSAVTNEGIIYQVKGYDETFRTVIYYETSQQLPYIICYNLMIFDSLNDITLHKGSDLFDDRLHLRESVHIEGFADEKDTKHEFSVEDKIIDDFLTALNNGIFVDPASEEYPTLKSAQTYTLSFHDSIGLVTNILVYEEGYASLKQAGVDEMIIKVDPKVCKDIIDTILPPQ